MGNKIIVFISLSAIVISWLIVITIFLLGGVEGEIGRLVRIYCLGYGYYPSDVVIARIISMFSVPIATTIIFVLLFSQIRKLLVLTSFTLFIISIISFLSSARGAIAPQVKLNVRIPSDIKLSDINGNEIMLKGDYVLTFFYISCHGSCPLIVKVVKNAPNNKNIILVSLNPYNTNEELKQFYFENGLKDNIKIVRIGKDELLKLLNALNLKIEIPNDKNAQINHPVVFYKIKDYNVVEITYGLKVRF